MEYDRRLLEYSKPKVVEDVFPFLGVFVKIGFILVIVFALV